MEPPEPLTVRVESGRLQDLWQAVVRACDADQHVAVDLCGATFSGRTHGLKLSVARGTKTMYDRKMVLAPRSGLTLRNGAIALDKGVCLVVASGLVKMEALSISGPGMESRKRASACLMRVSGPDSNLEMTCGWTWACVHVGCGAGSMCACMHACMLDMA
eukprot:358688-Chlamydomonas_euryale.AAC.3